MHERVDAGNDAFVFAHFHDDVEARVHEQVDHENDQNVRIEIDAVLQQLVNSEGHVAHRADQHQQKALNIKRR